MCSRLRAATGVTPRRASSTPMIRCRNAGLDERHKFPRLGAGHPSCREDGPEFQCRQIPVEQNRPDDPSRQLRSEIPLTPDHYVDNLWMAVSLVASTGGIALMPLYARNLLPPTVISRPLAGVPPTIDLSLGYNEANTSPLIKAIVSRIGDLKFAND